MQSLISPQEFSFRLRIWYQSHKRDLPWRHTQNPYYIWLSEVILQQTRVVQGLPYYQKFITQFPTINDLATAQEQDVLRLWQGLGYYSRARNLHQTAKIVVEEHGGIFPDNYAGLLKLKGIGPYTAAAIASLAFNEKVAVLDGNVYRVLSRVFGEETDIASSQAQKIFIKLANSLLPDTEADTHNQAMMELGALQCVPVAPKCMFCTFNDVCVANNTGRQGILPIKNKKISIKNRFFNYIVIENNQKIWLKKRNEKDIWAGMYDFYLIESHKNLDIDELARDPFLAQILPNAVIQHQTKPNIHVLTHQKIHTTFNHLIVNQEFTPDFLSALRAYSLDEIDDLPKSTLVNNYLKEYFF